MSSSVIKDFFREIKRNFGRFFSILFIVMLGTAFFAGLRSTGHDMKYSSDIYYDRQKLMDIQVIGTLGLTDDDLEDIRKIDGVETAVGNYTKDVLCLDDDREIVLHTVAMTDNINIADVKEGRLPRNSRECLIDSGAIFSSDADIGDTITIQSGSSDDDLSDSIKYDTFTIVGKGYLPYYTDLSRGTSSIGNGAVRAFLLLHPDAYDMDIYTEIYVSVSGSNALTNLSNEYKDLIKPVYDAIDDMSESASRRRYDSIYQDAYEEISDARAEIDDGWKELEDAETELADGRRQLEDARIEVAKNEDDIRKGQEEIDRNRAELEDKRRELEDGLSKLEKAQAELDDNKAQLLDGIKEVDAGLAQVEAGYTELEANREQLSAYPVIPPDIAAQLEATQAQLDATKAQLDATKAQLLEGMAQIEAGQKEIDENRATIEDGHRQIAEGEEALNEAQAEIDDGNIALRDARNEINENSRELEDAQAEYDDAYEDAVTDLTDAEQELADAQADLDALSVPKWYVLDREMMVGVVGYDQNAGRMDSIGNIFPIIFFLIAALVCLTGMTRMVDEQRVQIGSMKALGYSSSVIAGRYFWYAMLATVTGSIIGIYVGSKFFPYFIINAYGSMYTGMPEIHTPINWDQAILALVAAVASTGIATLAACANQLKSNPASLMRPEAPKGGHRVFLEHVPFIWNNIKFTNKATIRNLFRYKKRLIMTIIGIGGCMSLLLVGYGLKDSIQVVAQEQYINIFKYDASATMDSESDDSDIEDFISMVNSYDGVTGTEEIYMTTADFIHGKTTRAGYILVPSDASTSRNYIELNDRVTGEAYAFPEKGAAISEKTANMLGIGVGDMVTIRKDESDVSVEIVTVSENYIQHYIYMSEDTYRDLYGHIPDYNTLYINYEKMTEDEESDFGSFLMAQDVCTGVTFVTDLGDDITDMLAILDSVIWILIISAGLLAFVVLYSLNSINIMERRRELATLKVLGFYDGEVSMYIFRENMVLTVLGIVLGLLLGTLLHNFTVVTVEVDLMMFGRVISIPSYIISSLLTFGFSILINLYMHFSLKRIDMVESLKSVE